MIKWLLKLLYPTDKGVPTFTVLTVLAVLSVIGLTIYHVLFLRLPFDPSTFGEGIAWPLGGHGAAAWGQAQQDKTNG